MDYSIFLIYLDIKKKISIVIIINIQIITTAISKNCSISSHEHECICKYSNGGYPIEKKIVISCVVSLHSMLWGVSKWSI